MASHVITYKVVPVSRFQLVRMETIDHGNGVASGGALSIGEFHTALQAEQVRDALAATEPATPPEVNPATASHDAVGSFGQYRHASDLE